jgi:hypothetical protein
MVNLTFVQGSNTLVIAGSIVYGTEFSDARYNQHSQLNAIGDLITFDTGFNRVTTEILIKNVSYTDGENLRAFISTRLIYQLNTFTLTPSSSEVNLGNGKGTALTGCKFSKTDDDGVLKYVPPGLYQVSLPVTYRRT